LKDQAEAEADDDHLGEEVADVPDIADVKINGGLGVEIDNELHHPGTKGKAGDKEEETDGDQAEEEAVFLGLQGWFEEAEGVNDNQGEGGDDAGGDAGIDRQVKELVGVGQDDGNAFEVEEFENERQDALVIDEAEDAGGEDNGQENVELPLDLN